ncbi:hypothetical protein [Saccharothrix sp. HUAS TT1]|uniref:hypothetical protein n=1 Tax=unclassified Saccharothrix TaxID=2593673 RepID=UPI00345C1706
MVREAHNELSGTADASAQAHTVNGGVHFHGSPRREPGARAWFAHGLFAVGIFVVLSVGLQSRGGDPPPGPAPAAGGPALALRIPARLDRATFRYRADVPEGAQVLGLEGRRCGDRIHGRVGIAHVGVDPSAGALDLVARAHADRWVRLRWGDDAMTKYGAPRETGRVAADGGARYYGVQLRVDVLAPHADPCLGRTGVVHVLVLDVGSAYCVLVLFAATGSDPGSGEPVTDRDLADIVAGARPAR